MLYFIRKKIGGREKTYSEISVTLSLIDVIQNKGYNKTLHSRVFSIMIIHVTRHDMTVMENCLKMLEEEFYIRKKRLLFTHNAGFDSGIFSIQAEAFTEKKV